MNGINNMWVRGGGEWEEGAGKGKIARENFELDCPRLRSRVSLRNPRTLFSEKKKQ